MVRQAAERQHQPHHCARRLHPARPRLVQREAQEANGEDNRDGSDRNLSWNCGAEGPSDDPSVNALRERQKRNLLVTLLLSIGVPMLLAGDERGKSQAGNNVYCQDNETGWTDWIETPEQCAVRIRPPPDRAAPRPPDLSPRQFLHRPADRRRPDPRHLLDEARRQRDDSRRLGDARRPGDARLRPRYRRARAPRRAAVRRRLPAVWSMPSTSLSRSSCRTVPSRNGDSSSTRPRSPVP